MLPSSSHLSGRSPQPAFVRKVRVSSRLSRRRRIDILIWVCWVLIAAKSALVVWAVDAFRIPFSPLWVIVPTVTFATLCTLIYYRRRC